jgi:phosphoenolpyruvate carboxylase
MTKKKKLFTVWIGGVKDGDPMSEAKAKARVAELEAENHA